MSRVRWETFTQQTDQLVTAMESCWSWVQGKVWKSWVLFLTAHSKVQHSYSKFERFKLNTFQDEGVGKDVFDGGFRNVEPSNKMICCLHYRRLRKQTWIYMTCFFFVTDSLRSRHIWHLSCTVKTLRGQGFNRLATDLANERTLDWKVAMWNAWSISNPRCLC